MTGARVARAEACARPQFLVKGQVALCDGLQVNQSEALQAILLKEVEVPKIKQEVQFTMDKWALDTASLEEKLRISNERGDRYKKLYEKTVEGPEFYETPYFGAGVGAAAVILIYFLMPRR